MALWRLESLYIANASLARDSRVCMKTCFCHLNVVWRPLAEERLAVSTLKSTFSGLQFCRWQYWSIFIRLAAIASETREMSRNFNRTWPYSSSRSSILVSMESPYVTFYHWLIVTLAVSATVFEIFTLNDKKLMLILPTPPLFDAPLEGTP